MREEERREGNGWPKLHRSREEMEEEKKQIREGGRNGQIGSRGRGGQPGRA
jgi:hypothetical protein